MKNYSFISNTTIAQLLTRINVAYVFDLNKKNAVVNTKDCSLLTTTSFKRKKKERIQKQSASEKDAFLKVRRCNQVRFTVFKLHIHRIALHACCFN